jgi:hypothetical protein
VSVVTSEQVRDSAEPQVWVLTIVCVVALVDVACVILCGVIRQCGGGVPMARTVYKAASPGCCVVVADSDDRLETG